MDWKNLIADETRIIPCHYTRGRAGSIKAVTIHHMAGNLSIADCYNVWTNNEASAHYAVQADGRIGQLVNDSDTAWACGNTWANANTISIEHANNSSNPWTVHQKALDAGAHLTAAICAYYNLGEPQWMVNVFPHKHWSPTACPGELAGSQNAEYMRLAKKYYKELKGGSVGQGKWIQESSGKKRWWYRHADGSYTKNAWEKIDGLWYFFDKDGWMKTGWLSWKNNKYYLQEKSTKDFKEGQMRTGWVQLKNVWYWFDDSGAAAKSTCKQINGKWYAFDSNCKMKTSISVDTNGALKL